MSRSSWNFVSVCACALKIVPEPYQQYCQWALNINPARIFIGSLRSSCNILTFQGTFIVLCLCWIGVTSLAGGCSISTFEYPLHQGVNFRGSFCVLVFVLSSTWMPAVLSVLQRSITLLLPFAWSPTLPKPRELRLSRLLSSIVYLSTIYEECKYHVLQPFGSWDTFVFLIVILIVVGMLSLYTVPTGCSLRPRGPVTRFRSRTMRSQRKPQRSPARTFTLTPVQAMLVPNTPQASILGQSPESNSVGAVGTAVPMQATPGTPIH